MTALHLASGDWSVTLAPEDGARVTALRFGTQEMLAPRPDGPLLDRPFGAFWMIPWANRLDAGRLGTYRLPVNHPKDDTAIHGLSRDRPWLVAALAPNSARLTQRVDAAPYRYDAELDVTLDATGVAMSLAVTNRGAAPMPFGAGWHPWFVRPAGTRLAFHAAQRCTHDVRGLPVSAEPTTGLDGGEEAILGLDTHFAGWDGAATIAWPSLTLHLRATGALATNLQVFAPPARPVLCVEPSSHLPDVANRPEMAALGPMRQLTPGESLAGRITLRTESSHRP